MYIFSRKTYPKSWWLILHLHMHKFVRPMKWFLGIKVQLYYCWFDFGVLFVFGAFMNPFNFVNFIWQIHQWLHQTPTISGDSIIGHLTHTIGFKERWDETVSPLSLPYSGSSICSSQHNLKSDTQHLSWGQTDKTQNIDNTRIMV